MGELLDNSNLYSPVLMVAEFINSRQDGLLEGGDANDLVEALDLGEEGKSNLGALVS